MPPTVLADVTQGMVVAQEEIFGPVACVMRYDTEDEAIAIANGTAYGLTCALVTEDHFRASRLADRLKAGMVFVNNYMRRAFLGTPSAACKGSGFGRENAAETLREFVRAKNIRFPSGKEPVPGWPPRDSTPWRRTRGAGPAAADPALTAGSAGQAGRSVPACSATRLAAPGGPVFDVAGRWKDVGVPLGFCARGGRLRRGAGRWPGPRWSRRRWRRGRCGWGGGGDFLDQPGVAVGVGDGEERPVAGVGSGRYPAGGPRPGTGGRARCRWRRCRRPVIRRGRPRCR